MVDVVHMPTLITIFSPFPLSDCIIISLTVTLLYCLLIYAHKANQCHNAGSTWKNGFSMPKNCMMRNL